MENNEQKVVLEVANITSSQASDIIKMIKDIPMEGRQMRIMSATCYDKPTSSSCEYCDLKNYKDNFDNELCYQIRNGSWNNLYMIYNKRYKEFSIRADSGDGIADTKIIYCPFCGRYLGGEDAN